MDAVAILRVARVVLGMCVFVVAIAFALRRRIEWWQVIWLLIYTSHYLVFTTYILVAGWMGVINTPFARTWSLLLDIHGSLAVLMYLIVISRIANGQAVNQEVNWLDANGHRIFRIDLFRNVRRVRRGSIHQPNEPALGIAEQWESFNREVERDRSNRRSVARSR